MIPIKSMRESLEKNAAVHGEAIKKTLSFIKRHPWLTIGAIGGTAGGLSLISDLSKTVLPTYHIINEEHKRGIMNDQTKTLRNIEEYIARSQQPKKQDPRFIPSIQPLA
jgi:hypothetical protein